ncbi:hypothetical protein C8R43DRAFT_960781 [Mycena crocata]|nr:hypothetical protein C8R43DRAFT_960781 [Mycena crocata]
MPHGAGRMECSAARPRVTFRMKNPPQWNTAAARVFDVGTTNDAYSLNERNNQTVRPNINREAEVRRVLATAQHEENGALSRILHLWVTMDQSHNDTGGKEMRFKIVDTKAADTIFIGETHQSRCAVTSLVVRFTNWLVLFRQTVPRCRNKVEKLVSTPTSEPNSDSFALYTLGGKSKAPGLQVPPTHVISAVHKLVKICCVCDTPAKNKARNNLGELRRQDQVATTIVIQNKKGGQQFRA